MVFDYWDEDFDYKTTNFCITGPIHSGRTTLAKHILLLLCIKLKKEKRPFDIVIYSGSLMYEDEFEEFYSMPNVYTFRYIKYLHRYLHYVPRAEKEYIIVADDPYPFSFPNIRSDQTNLHFIVTSRDFTTLPLEIRKPNDILFLSGAANDVILLDILSFISPNESYKFYVIKDVLEYIYSGDFYTLFEQKQAVDIIEKYWIEWLEKPENDMKIGWKNIQQVIG